jgi:hypothetical protein
VGGLSFRAVLGDGLAKQVILVLAGAPATRDVELDPVACGIGCGSAEGTEQIGVEVGHGRNVVVEDRHPVKDGTVSRAKRTTGLTGRRAVGDGTATVLTATDVDEWGGGRGRGRRQPIAEGCGERRDDGKQAGGTDPANPDPAGRGSCWLPAGHASSQGRVALPARMRFSICRRYAPALASEHARVAR